MAFGSASTTSPSNSTFSSFAKRLQPQIFRVAEPLHDTRLHLLQHLRCVDSMRRCAAGTAFPHVQTAGGGLSDAPVYTSGPSGSLALPAGWRAVVGRRLRRRLVLVGVELRPAGAVCAVVVVL